jgi:penicillin-binding protein 1A
VGFDSRESLGEKETGAKAALPIWMNWMRAAIAGKDNEKFLGDEAVNSTAEQKLVAVARPAATPSASSARMPAKPAAPGAVQPTAGSRLQVRPALPAQPLPTKPSGSVKPALPSRPS